MTSSPKVYELLDALNLTPGMTVVEIGANRLPIREAVGPHGKLYTVQNELYGTSHIPSASCDLVLLVNTWDRIPDRTAFLHDARRFLLGNASLVIIDAQINPVIHALERNSWSIHRHHRLSDSDYLIESAPTDESVQS